MPSPKHQAKNFVGNGRGSIGRKRRSWSSSALHLSSLADLGGETSLDSGNTSSGAAVVTGDEVKTVLTLVEFGIGGFAGLAGDILD